MTLQCVRVISCLGGRVLGEGTWATCAQLHLFTLFHLSKVQTATLLLYGRHCVCSKLRLPYLTLVSKSSSGFSRQTTFNATPLRFSPRRDPGDIPPVLVTLLLQRTFPKRQISACAASCVLFRALLCAHHDTPLLQGSQPGEGRDRAPQSLRCGHRGSNGGQGRPRGAKKRGPRHQRPQ